MHNANQKILRPKSKEDSRSWVLKDRDEGPAYDVARVRKPPSEA